MKTNTQRHVIFSQVIAGSIRHTINAFLLDRKSRNLSPATIDFYNRELELFASFLDDQGITMIEELSPDVIRRWLLFLAGRRNGGGVHANYRCIRALLFWAWDEMELDTRNPITRVDPPKRNTQALPGVPISDVLQMIEVCKGDKLAGRDKAILSTLADTGLRASELTGLMISDLD